MKSFRPTSAAQYAAATAGTLPEFEQVAPDVWALPVAMHDSPLPFSFCYLLRATDGGVHLVDPGMPSESAWPSLVHALDRIGATADDVRSLVITHLHPDHLGMAETIRQRTSARVLMHSAEVRAMASQTTTHWTQDFLARQFSSWDVPADRLPELHYLAANPPERIDTDADRTIDDGEILDIPGFHVEALWTPGHTPGHICLRDEERGLLYSGDHLLPNMFGGLALGGPTVTNALADYLASLDRIEESPELEVLPGHGFRFEGLAERSRLTREHHLRRTLEVDAALAEDPDLTTWQVASRLTWSAGWANLRDFFLYSALTQTAMHTEFVQDHPEALEALTREDGRLRPLQ